MPDSLPSIEALQTEIDQLRLVNQQLSQQLSLYQSELLTHKTQLSRVQQALKRTQLLKDFLEQHTLFLITDQQGIVHYVNDRFCELSQYTRGELVGQNANKVSSHYHSTAFFSHLWQTIQQGNSWEGEIRNQAKDGSYFWVDMVILPLPDEEGKPKEYVAIRKDITFQKQAQAQLRFDAHILTHIQDAVVGLDANYRITYWNQGAEKLYGLQAAQVLGQHLEQAYRSKWLHPQDEVKAMQELGQQGYCKVEIIHQLKSGKQIHVEATTQVLTNEQGEPSGLLAVIRDGSQRKQAQEALEATLQELEKRNYELDNYVYKVSHDLRAPLTSMQGLLNLIQREENMEVNKRYLHLIESRVSKLDGYIQSILHHSKMVNEKMQITEISLEKIISESFEELKHYAHWEKVKVRIQTLEDTLFYSDEFRVMVILRNIISNAIKYLNVYAEQSYLHFRIDISREKAIIEVEDNGIGIDKIYVDKIFDMFFRATQAGDGSGLGLYIVKQAVDKLGGNIQVESQKGLGTTFIIILPNLGTSFVNRK